MGKKILRIFFRAYAYVALIMFFSGFFGAMWLLSTGQNPN
jgi:hypothetical protein